MLSLNYHSFTCSTCEISKQLLDFSALSTSLPENKNPFLEERSSDKTRTRLSFFSENSRRSEEEKKSNINCEYSFASFIKRLNFVECEYKKKYFLESEVKIINKNENISRIQNKNIIWRSNNSF